MKKILLFLLALSGSVFAADVQFYNLKTAPRVRPSTRFVVQDQYSGSRNVTGEQLQRFHRDVYINSTSHYRVFNNSGKLIQEVTPSGCLIIY